MTTPTRPPMRRGADTVLALLLLGAVACERGGAATKTSPAAGPVTIDVVRVVEQPLSVALSLPAELTPYLSVAIYPKVTGFVKTIRVDRGARVRAGDVIATLDAPELLAQRSEAQSKLQEAEGQLAAARSKADADQSTSDKLKAASATPGVVAGNDVLIAEKAAEASQNQMAAGQQNVEAARQAMNAIRDTEGYLRVTAPFEGVVTERNVHPGALSEQRFPSQWRRTPARPFSVPLRELRRRWISTRERWPWSSMSRTRMAALRPVPFVRSVGRFGGPGPRSSCRVAAWLQRPTAHSSCAFATARRNGSISKGV